MSLHVPYSTVCVLSFHIRAQSGASCSVRLNFCHANVTGIDYSCALKRLYLKISQLSWAPFPPKVAFYGIIISRFLSRLKYGLLKSRVVIMVLFHSLLSSSSIAWSQPCKLHSNTFCRHYSLCSPWSTKTAKGNWVQMLSTLEQGTPHQVS